MGDSTHGATGEHSYNGGKRDKDMIARARVHETLFRSTAGGREPLAPPGEGGTHVHYQPSRRVGIGCVTSKPAGMRPKLTFFEMLALRLGVTLAEAKRLHAEGKVQ